jgi:hypothetical protein
MQQPKHVPYEQQQMPNAVVDGSQNISIQFDQQS